MKRLVPVLALVVAATLMLGGCMPVVAPPSADEAFWGVWVNEDPDTGGITRVEIAPWTVHMWGACSPTDCDWGETIYSIHQDQLHVVWDQGFVVRVQVLALHPDGTLEVDTVSHYTDGTGTATQIDTFVREAAMP